VPDTVQQGFGFEAEGSRPASGRLEGRKRRVEFEEGQRRLYVGQEPLEQYLERRGLKAVRALQELMEQVEVSAFEAAYKPGGRPPLHPRVVLSLIVWGRGFYVEGCSRTTARWANSSFGTSSCCLTSSS